ncbi:histone deacetylase [Bacillus sp. HMSC76G11]|uniref:Acetoin utilization protein AcuC n=1 Tax=Metabacillus idriensis TaxID=324768 RepID=A0A6I2MAU9_9BACI|nr:acetoin utilization protein AcuC [Metabacillus idriensis]MRX55360.1 acetoin utilization protein AcuC [Metabacillus idriensis]OHR68129.1 histone deacetylase [Bacillus sp. HMSC76G11]
MMKENIFIYSPLFQQYKFSQDHPFNQLRVELTYDLLKKMNALSDDELAAPRMATDEELALVHDKKYIDAVKKAGSGELDPKEALNYGIGTEDTPIFKNMHEASALLVGGTLTAVEQVMEGKAKRALNLGGGLHHGFRGKASGFCIYNDSSVAIKFIQEKYQAKVLYIDTDAHHGDGVQWTFYDDPSVCTLSIHETGRYLFPGTGNVTERGAGQGYGYSFNIPLDAFTEDESWIEAYRQSIREIAAFFKPDVIITQNGADAHFYDPLTHFATTTAIFKEIPRIAQEIADQYCGGKWIAVGGGGYDIWRVVPRAWAMIWLQMKQQTAAGPLPEEWIKRWQPEAPVALPSVWEDGKDQYKAIPRKLEIEEKNAQTVAKALYPLRQNHGKNRKTLS